MAGNINLVKSGSGSQVLSANNYNGDTTVSGGTLEIGQAALATNSTVTVVNGAQLQLDFSVTNAIGYLVLNGSSASLGVHNSTTDPAYLLGAGSLLVQSTAASPVSTNAYLTSLVLTPAGTLNPAFVSNTIAYTATETNYGGTFTVTAASMDPAATNKLTVNGAYVQLLTNGVPSAAQGLNPNPGVTEQRAGAGDGPGRADNQPLHYQRDATAEPDAQALLDEQRERGDEPGVELAFGESGLPAADADEQPEQGRERQHERLGGGGRLQADEHGEPFHREDQRERVLPAGLSLRSSASEFWVG